MNPHASIMETPADFDRLTAGMKLSAAAVVRSDEPLAPHTTLRVGGPADLYVQPASEEDLRAALRFCRDSGMPWFVLGRGSNLLVKDGGFRGMVLSLSHPYFSRIEVADTRLVCGAGARLKAVANEAKRHALTGLEFFEGIPGTVGGALRMNAGAMGSATFEVVDSVRLMDTDGEIRDCAARDLKVEYRSCASLVGRIALSAQLRGRTDAVERIAERMNQFSRKRWSSQPAAPSAGCAFKNPATVPAGKLIDELGLKGTRVGGARISNEHGNFIVNDGAATSRDVLALIELIQKRARVERGIELRTEIEIIGE
jgi:UDP-N-acetylenolpyruvoylglucosamine reductase